MESENKPTVHIPSGLLYDHRLDAETAVSRRIEERMGPGEAMQLVVHMKDGATYVGALAYFDPESLRLVTRGGGVDLATKQVAHIIKVPAEAA